MTAANARATRTSSFTSSTSSWAALDSGGSYDLTISASTGDVIELGVSMLAPGASGTYKYLDVATMVSGSATNWVSSGSGTNANGVYAWFTPSASGFASGNIGGSVLYTVQAGDIVSGQVTFRLYGRTNTGTASYPATSNDPAVFFAVARSATPTVAVTVAAPALAIVEAVPAPTVTPGVKITVGAPALAIVAALLAPTVSAGIGVRVDAPTLAVTMSVPAPVVTMAQSVSVTAPTLALATAVPAPTVIAGASVAVAAPALGVTFAAPAPTVTVEAPLVDDAFFDFRIARAFTWAESGVSVDVPEIVTLRFPTSRGFEMRGQLVPVAPPLGVLTEWPIQRQAHLMPALTAATPRFRVGNPVNDGEYEVDYGETGRLHVFVGGQDVTYLRDVPAGFDDYSSAVPFNATAATVKMPQRKPWDESGVGDFSRFTPDAAVELVMVRPGDAPLEHLWEGFFQVDEEASGSGEDYTFRAQGLFAQAAHEPWDPPVVLQPTDIGYLVADALNAVTHRRWAKVPRVKTGILSRNRGTQGQSVWQYVQDLLAQAWTDDGRQWTLARVGPYQYRIQVKAAMSTVHWTVTKGAPGVEVNLSVDQSTRRDAIYGRGFAPDGGYWCNRVFPGLEFGVPPRYPFDNTSNNLDVGTSDSETDTGNGITTWQRQMRELGYPVTVDGVMNSADTKWVTKIQRDRGLTVDGSLGPQTWAATWENNSTDADLTSYRLPLATLPGVEPWLYSATGAKIGTNPADDRSIIRHAMPEVDFGSGVKKSEAVVLARKMLAREQNPGISGTVTLLTDPHEADASRYDIKPGDNVKVVGHRGEDVVLQVAEVSVQGLAVNLTVDSRARDALTVLAILERNRDALRDPAARNGTTNESSLNKASVVQYESESKAGTVPRTAVNGDSGLWTIRKTFVSQVGVAKIEFTATSPKAELFVALFNRPIRTSVLASKIGDPGSSSDGWYDNIDELQEKYGLMEVFGSPGSPGGYWPRQKGDGPLTGRLRDSSSSLYDSPYGGFVWVAMFTSRSTWVEGRVFPAVPT